MRLGALDFLTIMYGTSVVNLLQSEYHKCDDSCMYSQLI